VEAQTGTILLFNKAYPPWPGGIERHVELLAEGLSARGWQVVVLCAGNQRFQYEERREGLHVRREANWGTLWSQPISPGLIRQIGRLQPDLVHIHTPFPFGNLALSIRRPRCRLVVTWHSDIVRQRVARPFLIPLENWLLRRADAVIATSPALLEQSAYLPRYREKCHIIPLGIDPKSYFSMEPAVLEKAERLRKSLPHPLAVFVGRLVGYKGLEVLLRAVKKTGNVSALIVGDGPLRGDLERQTGRMGLTDRVRFAGHVADKDLPAYLRAGDFFVLPSISRNEAWDVPAGSHGREACGDFHRPSGRGPVGQSAWEDGPGGSCRRCRRAGGIDGNPCEKPGSVQAVGDEWTGSCAGSVHTGKISYSA